MKANLPRAVSSSPSLSLSSSNINSSWLYIALNSRGPRVVVVVEPMKGLIWYCCVAGMLLVGVSSSSSSSFFSSRGGSPAGSG